MLKVTELEVVRDEAGRLEFKPRAEPREVEGSAANLPDWVGLSGVGGLIATWPEKDAPAAVTVEDEQGRVAATIVPGILRQHGRTRVSLHTVFADATSQVHVIDRFGKDGGSNDYIRIL